MTARLLGLGDAAMRWMGSVEPRVLFLLYPDSK